MDQIFDVLIIGGGAAATSAVLTLKNRGKSCAVVSNREETSSLFKAEKITNYPGLPPMTGAEMTALFRRQAEEAGAVMITGRAISVMPMEGLFGVAVGSDYYMAKSLIIAAGITREKLYPGEAEYLGRGVSYCATCDGMLYRGKTVAVVGGGEEARHDADFLESIGCTVLRFEKNGRYEIRGGMKADTLVFAGEEHKVDCVFIIKDTVSVTKLVPGDCTGKPYQLAKAAGEGNVAALSACDYLAGK